MSSNPHLSTSAVPGGARLLYIPPTGSFNFTVPGGPSYPPPIEETAGDISSTNSSSSDRDWIEELVEELSQLFSEPEAEYPEGFRFRPRPQLADFTLAPVNVAPSTFLFSAPDAYPAPAGIPLTIGSPSMFTFTAPRGAPGFPRVLCPDSVSESPGAATISEGEEECYAAWGGSGLH
jgi:hypothetical protein